MEESAEQIESAIAALEAQRALLGDAVVAMAVAPLQEKLAARRERENRHNLRSRGNQEAEERLLPAL